MTVEELLQLPTIKGLKLISGNLGVHREISTVTVVDTPDGFQWLKGNEVVITTTYALEKTPNSLFHQQAVVKKYQCTNCQIGPVHKGYSGKCQKTL